MGFTKPGHYIYELLEELNITHKTANMLIDTVDEAMTLLEEGTQCTPTIMSTVELFKYIIFHILCYPAFEHL